MEVGAVTQQWRAPLAFIPLVMRSARGAAPSGSTVGSLDAHLTAALDWLRRAQDRCPDGGVSYGYSARGGWKPPYRETSGYILTTFYRASDSLAAPDLAARAERIARWLMSVQNDDGSFSNPKYGTDGIVFDTGQDLFGLVRAYERTGDDAFLAAAVRAGRWLVEVASGDGRWRVNEHFGTPHAYNSRTAWALLLLDRVAPDPDQLRVARANLDWALDCQQPSGFYRDAAFVAGDDPYTHNISYTTCGLQESGWLIDEPRYAAAGRRCADAALGLLSDGGFLPGQITADGRPAARYACLTGTCQFAIVWAKWFDLTGEERYRKASVAALQYVMDRHDITTDRLAVRGAVAGSSPLWGRYAPLSYPNWAAKFFVDAALLQRSWSS